MSTIRTYRAATVREALALVRADLGDDALILGQREIRQRSRPWPWRKATVESELTAACVPQRSRLTTEQFTSVTAVPSGEHCSPATSPPRPSSAPACPPLDPFRLYTQLLDHAAEDSVARQIVTTAQSRVLRSGGRPFADVCRELLAEFTPCGGPIQVTPGRRRITALIGTTGVGKTTTIAKLAADLRLRQQLRVGLITVDTFRVAAVEQLRTYAELMDLPLQVVSAPNEMSAALDELTGVDVVLIDTAGRSPADEPRIQELRSFLQAAQPDEVHLVASLTAGLPNLVVAAERFGRVGPTALLLTKLDEAAGPGAVISAARLTGLPLSYVTTGQEVPDDIETADAQRLARRVLPVSEAAPQPVGPHVEASGEPVREANEY